MKEKDEEGDFFATSTIATPNFTPSFTPTPSQKPINQQPSTSKFHFDDPNSPRFDPDSCKVTFRIFPKAFYSSQMEQEEDAEVDDPESESEYYMEEDDLSCSDDLNLENQTEQEDEATQGKKPYNPKIIPDIPSKELTKQITSNQNCLQGIQFFDQIEASRLNNNGSKDPTILTSLAATKKPLPDDQTYFILDKIVDDDEISQGFGWVPDDTRFSDFFVS